MILKDYYDIYYNQNLSRYNISGMLRLLIYFSLSLFHKISPKHDLLVIWKDKVFSSDSVSLSAG